MGGLRFTNIALNTIKLSLQGELPNVFDATSEA